MSPGLAIRRQMEHITNRSLQLYADAALAPSVLAGAMRCHQIATMPPTKSRTLGR
jgi:hypothetical protein